MEGEKGRREGVKTAFLVCAKPADMVDTVMMMVPLEYQETSLCVWRRFHPAQPLRWSELPFLLQL